MAPGKSRRRAAAGVVAIMCCGLGLAQGFVGGAGSGGGGAAAVAAVGAARGRSAVRASSSRVVLAAEAATEAPPAAAAPEGTAAGGAAGTDKAGAGVQEKTIILSSTERARTVMHVATSGTLCTSSSSADPALTGVPFGSHVDYVLDSNGWPVFLLADASMHTQNIKANPRVSMLCRTPRASPAQSAASLARVTIVGDIIPVEDDDELIQLKATFPLTHKYAEQLTQSKVFKFLKLKPEKVYYVGGFGVLSKWIPVSEYEQARPDVLANEAPEITDKLNTSKKDELLLACKHFLGRKGVDSVSVTTVDRLGMDLRLSMGPRTDEFRIGFQQEVASVEDAKSEIVKIFQEGWEREEGFAYDDEGPPVQQYAADIIRD